MGLRVRWSQRQLLGNELWPFAHNHCSCSRPVGQSFPMTPERPFCRLNEHWLQPTADEHSWWFRLYGSCDNDGHTWSCGVVRLSSINLEHKIPAEHSHVVQCLSALPKGKEIHLKVSRKFYGLAESRRSCMVVSDGVFLTLKMVWRLWLALDLCSRPQVGWSNSRREGHLSWKSARPDTKQSDRTNPRWLTG